jgi:hypothetical protein
MKWDVPTLFSSLESSARYRWERWHEGYVLLPVRLSFPFTSFSGLLVLGGVWERRLSVWRCRFPAMSSRRWWRCQGIMSSCALPRLGGVPLQCHQQACGGGAPSMELLYKSPASPLFRLWRTMEAGTGLLCCGCKACWWSMIGWWLDRARSSLDGDDRRQRASSLGQRSLGVAPVDRLSTMLRSHLFGWVTLWLFSKLCGDEALPDLGKTANRRCAPVASSGDRWHQVLWKLRDAEDLRGLNVILLF